MIDKQVFPFPPEDWTDFDICEAVYELYCQIAEQCDDFGRDEIKLLKSMRKFLNGWGYDVSKVW